MIKKAGAFNKAKAFNPAKTRKLVIDQVPKPTAIRQSAIINEINDPDNYHLSWWSQPEVFDKFKKNCGPDTYTLVFKKQIRSYIIKKCYKSILDCAAGFCSEYYGFKADGYNIDYTAVDSTQVLVDYGITNGINITRQFSDKLQFENSSFDCCLYLDTINLQVHYEETIKELIRVAQKEVIITFSKEFLPGEEDILEKRAFDRKGVCNLLYHHMSKTKLDKFLDSLPDITFEYRTSGTSDYIRGARIIIRPTLFIRKVLK